MSVTSGKGCLTYTCKCVGKGLGGGGFQHGEVEEIEGAPEGGFFFRGGFGEARETACGKGTDALEVLEPGLGEVVEVPDGH